MKILIAIPSKGRSKQIKLDTFAWLSGMPEPFQYKVFVEPQEYSDYAKEFGGDYFLHQLPENNRGLGYSLIQIKKYAQEREYDLIFKMDDDVLGWASRGKKSTIENSISIFRRLIIDCVEAFNKYKDVSAIGFPYRWELYQDKKWIAINMRLQTCYLIRTGEFNPREDISVFEDFYAYLNLRLNNKLTLRYGKAGINCKPVGINEGGHQEFNRGERALKESEILRGIYPALQFKKVSGKNWQLEPRLRGKFFNIRYL